MLAEWLSKVGDAAKLAECFANPAKRPGFDPRRYIKQMLLARAQNPSTRKVETEGSELRGHT